MAKNIKSIVRGLKAAVRAFKVEPIDNDSVGTFQVAGQKLTCAICGADEKKREKIYFSSSTVAVVSTMPFNQMIWSLACTRCGHIQLFNNEPERDRTR